MRGWPQGLLPLLAAAGLLAGLSAILSSRLAGRLSRSINDLDLSHPESLADYEELTPLVDRLREQNRTIHRQMEELSRERRDFEAITGNMSEGFLLLDKRLNVLSKNLSAAHLLIGESPDGTENLSRNGCHEDILRAAEKALAGQRTELILREDGRQYCVIVSPASAGGQPTGAVVVTMDVTEREEREALRREFSANVSHELKTPLTSITGFAELLKDGLVPPERTAEFAGDIYKESRRLISLVDDIIELSRLEENTQPYVWEDTDLYDLAADVLESLRPAAEARRVALQLEGEHAVVRGVTPILREMLYNLCDNAVKYNREGGDAAVILSQTEREIRVTVADTGIGIPFAHQSRVFERFYRVDQSRSRQIGGTGLGLPIVKHGAQIHNARLELLSAPGRGTTISIVFQKENLC